MEDKKTVEIPVDELAGVSGGLRVWVPGSAQMQCSACGLPEFYIIASDADSITLKCKCCGQFSKVAQ